VLELDDECNTIENKMLMIKEIYLVAIFLE